MGINSKFDIEEFSRSQRAMKCARQLFPHSGQQEAWAISALQRWHNTGETPEAQRDKRNPRWKESLDAFERRSKTKVLYYP